MRAILTAALGSILFLAPAVSPADAQVDLVGDIDCFGNPSLVASCDGRGSLGLYASTTDPSFTDRQFSSGGPSWTHLLTVDPSRIFSAVLTFRQWNMGTCCGSTTSVFFNNVLIGSLGYRPAVSTHSFNLDPSLLLSTNTVHISLGSGDVWGVDYSQLSYQALPATATPEPVSMALLGTGLAGLGAVRRRRREGAETA